jgi:hypothetical protein
LPGRDTAVVRGQRPEIPPGPGPRPAAEPGPGPGDGTGACRA